MHYVQIHFLETLLFLYYLHEYEQCTEGVRLSLGHVDQGRCLRRRRNVLLHFQAFKLLRVILRGHQFAQEQIRDYPIHVLE